MNKRRAVEILTGDIIKAIQKNVNQFQFTRAEVIGILELIKLDYAKEEKDEHEE